VNSHESPGEKFRSELAVISETAKAYFEGIEIALNSAHGYSHPNEVLTEHHYATARQLRQKLTTFGVDLLTAFRSSPLLEQTDEAEMRRVLRAMSATLSLKKYQYSEAYVVSDEDQFRGLMPASQNERDAYPYEWEKDFISGVKSIEEKLDFVAPSPENIAGAIVASQVANVRKYRPNTAFIMMQIDEANGELEDVKNCIKEVFKEFGDTAVRSDEIEHSDVATQRILNEIATSEFSIVDLSGERPSVYYELGFAHALDKRPILYRKKGTKLHFDILVHNCPEYKNVADLKEKLRARLVEMTGRRPKS
jgi:predicted RNA-binding protein with EMAP domain